jgi:hypothetical protein
MAKLRPNDGVEEIRAFDLYRWQATLKAIAAALSDNGHVSQASQLWQLANELAVLCCDEEE